MVVVTNERIKLVENVVTVILVNEVTPRGKGRGQSLVTCAFRTGFFFSYLFYSRIAQVRAWLLWLCVTSGVERSDSSPVPVGKFSSKGKPESLNWFRRKDRPGAAHQPYRLSFYFFGTLNLFEVFVCC